MLPSWIKMVTKQFKYTHRLYINSRQDTRDEGKVYSKINLGYKFGTGPIFFSNWRIKIDGIKSKRIKNALLSSEKHKLRMVKVEF